MPFPICNSHRGTSPWVVVGLIASLAVVTSRARADEPPAEPAAEVTAAPAATTEAASPIDFARDIEPIFVLHCLKCHGPDKRSGGLRLDSAALAAAGGDSGMPILGGTLETNELYRRVAASDRTYRMPKNAEPLPASEIELIRRWVEANTPWAAVKELEPPPRTFFARWSMKLEDVTQRYEGELVRLMPYGLAFLAFQVALLVAARVKRAYENDRPWTRGRAQRVCRWCSRLTGREQGLLWILSVGALGLVALWTHDQKLAAELAKAQMVQAMATSPWSKTPYGYPPVPLRPDHPKQLAGTYYRGNCERNAELFNNGNYLTATFRIELCDAEHRAVAVGDPLPKGGLSVRIEIERAPGTASELFSKAMVASVFFSEKVHSENSQEADDGPPRLQTLEEGQRWVTYYPLGSPNAEGKLRGLIYVYTGRSDHGKLRGTPHYAVRYDLQIVDGKLGEDSELWMNSFGNAAVAMPEPPAKIPYREWFDYRPIAPIVGENSKDPKLLGIEEYVKKGLIAPDGSTPANSAPTDAQPPKPDGPPPHKDE